MKKITYSELFLWLEYIESERADTENNPLLLQIAKVVYAIQVANSDPKAPAHLQPKEKDCLVRFEMSEPAGGDSPSSKSPPKKSPRKPTKARIKEAKEKELRNKIALSQLLGIDILAEDEKHRKEKEGKK